MIDRLRASTALLWLSDRLTPLVAGRLPAELETQLATTLRGARWPIDPDRYLATAVAVGLLVGLGGGCLGGTLGVVFFGGVDGWLSVGLVLGTAVGAGVAGFVVGVGGVAAALYRRVVRRRREINLLLPDAVAFLYALAAGGRNQLELIDAIAHAEDAYGAVAVEFQTIQTELTYFDTDYRTAIRNQALRTPSDELREFLTDLLSVLSSGGDLAAFLDEQTTAQRRTATQRQERTLETLELFGEMYLTLSLFPLLLIIVLVVMQLLGQGSMLPLYLTVYVLIPALGIAFLIAVSVVTPADPGSGTLPRRGGEFCPQTTVGQALYRQHRWRQRIAALSRPHVFFRAHPLATLAVTVPVAVAVVGAAVWAGIVPTAWRAAPGLVQRPVWGTVVYVYVPAYIIGLPLCVCYEWHRRRRRAVTTALSNTLRKLSSANDTGLTFLESIRTVAATGTDTLAAELSVLHRKVSYGMRLRDALIEFTNTYQCPRLARTSTLIATAHETSDQLTRVLRTAAVASEHHDAIDRQRRDRTRMQVVIISFSFLTLLAVMALLQSQFVTVVDSVGATTGPTGVTGLHGGTVDPAVLSLLFFHAVTAHAIVSGLIAGRMRHGTLLAGVKYAVSLLTVALGVWTIL